MRMYTTWLSKCPQAMRRCLTRVICPCRIIVELYEVVNWQNQEPTEWTLADETWECDAKRIYFYDRAEAQQTLVMQMCTKERHTDSGGHGWKW